MTTVTRAEPADATQPPPDWGAGLWRLSGRSDVAGWLDLPAHVDSVDEWVEAQAGELRAAWGSAWRDDQSAAVAGLLRGALAARPDDAALAFQLWPVPAPLVTHVRASFGARPAGLRLGPGDGVLYEAAGLGFGVQALRQVRVDDAGLDLIGIEIAFLGEDAAVVASLEPTIPELFAMVVGQFHAFVQTLEFQGPDGRAIVAPAPAEFLDAAPDATWADTVPAA